MLGERGAASHQQPDMRQIRVDFDRIAPFADDGWNHNNHYHDFLLNQLPPRCDHVLEIGCGRGAFARLLAKRANHVTALDLSPEMIRIAREQSADYANLMFEVGDVLEYALPANHFDGIASIATLHHLPLAPVLMKLKAALRPGGVLLVLDLYQSNGVSERLSDGVAVLVNLWLWLTQPHGEKASPAAQQAWAEHGQNDMYLTTAQARQICARVLPGAQVTRHLLWRYSIVWKKPAL